MYKITGHDVSICLYHLLYKTHQCFCDLAREIQIPEQ